MSKKYSDKAREAMPDSDFGDPANKAFPIKTAEDVIHAAQRLGEGNGDHDAIKQRIIAIAKRKGFPLPETWQEDKQKGVSRMGDKTEGQVPVTAVDGGIPPVLYMGVTRAYTADNGDWLVQGRAISEVVHQHGTIKTVFDYPSAKRAFERWRGNVREQHDPLKAVGHGLDWTPNDAEKAVDLVTRVSKGSPDTWAKLNDNTLTGYSIHLKPGFQTKWETINGERVLRYLDYDFAEISLVDAPGIPTCDVAIVRADGFINDEVVDISASNTPANEPPVQAVAGESDVARMGAAISQDRMAKMHEGRDATLMAARTQMTACGCAECEAMLHILDPDNDGDVDLPGSAADTDDDADALVERVMRRLMPVVVEQLQPSVMRYQAIAGDLSRLQVPSVDLAPVQRSIDALQERVTALGTTQNAMDEQVKRLAAIETMVKQIHETPMPGGPVLRAVDKRLITDPAPSQGQTMSNEEVIRRASELGIVDPRRLSPQQQVNAAMNAIQPLQS